MREHRPWLCRIRFSLLGLVAGALILTVAAPVAAAAANPAAGAGQQVVRISVWPHAAHAGRWVVVFGFIPVSGPLACPADNDAILTSTPDLFPPDGWGPAVTRAPSGWFATVYAVPRSTPPGTYHIGLRCGGGNVGVSTTLRVIAPIRR
jgi:hypothetical protein